MFNEICEIIVEQIGISREEINENSAFKEDLGIDSLDLFEIVMKLEERFDIEIETSDLEKVSTIKDVIEYLEKKGVTVEG